MWTSNLFYQLAPIPVSPTLPCAPALMSHPHPICIWKVTSFGEGNMKSGEASWRRLHRSCTLKDGAGFPRKRWRERFSREREMKFMCKARDVAQVRGKGLGSTQDLALNVAFHDPQFSLSVWTSQKHSHIYNVCMRKCLYSYVFILSPFHFWEHKYFHYFCQRKCNHLFC